MVQFCENLHFNASVLKISITTPITNVLFSYLFYLFILFSPTDGLITSGHNNIQNIRLTFSLITYSIIFAVGLF